MASKKLTSRENRIYMNDLEGQNTKSNVSMTRPELLSLWVLISFRAMAFLANSIWSRLPLNWIECTNSCEKWLASPTITKLFVAVTWVAVSWKVVVGIVLENSSDVKREEVRAVDLTEETVCCGVTERSLKAPRSKPEEYVVTPLNMTSMRFSKRFRTMHSSTNGVDLFMAFITLNPLIGYTHLSFSIVCLLNKSKLL